MGFTRRLFAGIAAGVLAIATGASVPAASAAQAHAAAPARQVQAASQVREGTIRPAQGGVDTPPEGAIVVAEQTQQALRDAISQAGAQATDAAPATVWIPAGTYVLNRTILLSSNIRILAHSGAVIKAENWNGADPVLLATNRDVQATKYSGWRNIEIVGGTWDLNQPNRMDNECVAFMVKHSDHVTISDVTVTNCQSHMINVSGSRNVLIKNSTFKNPERMPLEPTTALEPDLMRREAIHTDFMNPVGEDCVGQACDGTPAGDIVVTGNLFENVYSVAGTHHRLDELSSPGGTRYPGTSLTVTDNVFRNVRASAINLFSMDKAVVRNNKIEGTAPLVFAQLQDGRNAVMESNTGNAGSFLVQRSSSVSVSNMTIVPKWDWGVAVQTGSTATFTGVTIRDAKQGIVVNGKSTATVNSSTIEGITGGYGAGAREQSTLSMNNVNVKIPNTNRAAYSAVDVSEGSTLNMSGGSTSGGQNGIGVVGSSKATVTGTSVSGTFQNGIRFGNSSSGTVRSATISNTGLHGVNVAENATIRLEKSTITQTGQDGVNLNGAGSGCVVAGNTLRQIGRVGIWTMNGTRNAQVNGNDVTDTGRSGSAYKWSLASSGGSGNVFSNNCVGSAGVYFADGSATTNNNGSGCKSSGECQSGSTKRMFRMYNRISHEHLYTADENEKNVLSRGDWTYEGIGWVAPVKSSTPVYRLYNPVLGDHHYTTDQNEVNVLTRQHGWRYEGIGWYSDDCRNVPVYRQFTPLLRVGSHNYTADKFEYDSNNGTGVWRAEGVAWYAVSRQ